MKELFRITVLPEYLDECLDYIAEHTKHCKTEPGNLTSEAYQSKENPCEIYLISEWDSPEHAKMHVESEADHEFVKKMTGKEGAPVKMFDWTQLA